MRSWKFPLCAALVLAASCGSDGSGLGTPPSDVAAPMPLAGTMAAGSGGTTVLTGGVGGTMAGTGGTGGVAGTMAGTGGTGGVAGTMAGTGGVAGTMAGTGGTGGTGTCCADGDCICRDEPPTMLTTAMGPYATDSYDLTGVGCVYYPTDAEPPFSAVAISDGFGGSGGCSPLAQTSGWGPLYASYGIVAMIVNTTGGDQPMTRGMKLLGGIAGFKAENEAASSPLFGQLAGRYGTSGFSMGGGGTTYAASDDPTLLTSVAMMAWTPTGTGVVVPTLFTCGSSDTLAGCGTMGTPAYNEMPDTTPKMRVTVSSGHNGQPSAGAGMHGAWGVAFQKLFLDGDERWKATLLSGSNDATNIQ